MIRPARLEDEDAMLHIAAAVGLFAQDQLELLSDLFRKALAQPGEHRPFWLGAEHEGRVHGVVYCEPERMTEGTWNIQFIAVHPDHQNTGMGSTLINAAEHGLKQRKARIALVETAAVAEFDTVRTFYRRRGYEPEATIRDFYDTGVDKITFRKTLR